jgi:RNA polymerase sigma-70 factor (ECF subfamily)
VQCSEEVDLIRRARDLEETALSELYRRYANDIFRYIHYRVRDENVAEDLTGDVFTRMLQGLPGFTFRGAPFSAWLYNIAHARVVDYFRHQKVRVHIPLDEHLPSAGQHPEKAVELEEEHRTLLNAIGQLTDDQRQVLLSKFIERHSNAEIAAILGKTEGAVKSLQHRALASLQRILESQEDDGANRH